MHPSGVDYEFYSYRYYKYLYDLSKNDSEYKVVRQ